MGLFFSKVLEMSMASVLLIAAVALLRIPLKKAPKWFMGVLWTIVALRLLVPIQIEAGVGFMPDFGQIISKATGNVASRDGVYVSRDTVMPTSDVAVNETVDKAQALEAKRPVLSSASLRYLTILWIVGMVMAIGYASYSYISIRLKTRVSIRYRSSDKVYVCDEIDTPFIFGLIKPVIYLPSGLDHDTIINVIAHEKAHLKRKDHLRKSLGFFILTIHWFNPFVWLAYILFCRDIELACDERVISTMSRDEKKSYAESLLACSTKKRRMMVYPVAFGEVAVRTRIGQILNYRKPSFYLVLLLVMITGTLATCSFTKAADKIIITYTGADYEDSDEKMLQGSEASIEVLGARTRIEEIKISDETDEVKVNLGSQENTRDDSSVKKEEPKKEESPKEVVDVAEEITNEVTDDILIEGGIADTAVDTAFGITTDTLGLVDSILGW